MKQHIVGMCKCTCVDGFEGEHCDVPSPCAFGAGGNACKNGGSVTGTTGNCGCNCPCGFEGNNCETPFVARDNSLDGFQPPSRCTRGVDTSERDSYFTSANVDDAAAGCAARCLKRSYGECAAFSTWHNERIGLYRCRIFGSAATVSAESEPEPHALFYARSGAPEDQAGASTGERKKAKASVGGIVVAVLLAVGFALLALYNNRQLAKMKEAHARDVLDRHASVGHHANETFTRQTLNAASGGGGEGDSKPSTTDSGEGAVPQPVDYRDFSGSLPAIVASGDSYIVSPGGSAPVYIVPGQSVPIGQESGMYEAILDENQVVQAGENPAVYSPVASEPPRSSRARTDTFC